MTTNLLPVGTKVRVTEQGEFARRAYNAVVGGYDIHRTKYHLGVEYLPGMFTEPIAWAFLEWVKPLEEEKGPNDQPPD